MIAHFRIFCLIMPLVTPLVCCLLAAPVSAEESLRVGVASATVNPPEGVCLAGYDLNRKSTGVHDDLCVKAVAFDDGKSTLVLAVIDAISLQHPTVTTIREAAMKHVQGVNLSPERIILQATHTHCAPDTIGMYGPDVMHSGLSDPYMNMLVETAAAQIAKACQSLQPAKLAWAKTECKGWAVNDSEPDVLDNSVTILQCLDAEGKSLATLTNFACHPTVLDGDTTVTGADWVGYFYKKMTSALPGEHLFLQGGIGGWIQPETPERTFALAEKYGTDLAEKTLAALQNTQPVEGAAIRSANKVFKLPVQNPVFIFLAKSGMLPRDFAGNAVETEVAWFAIGNAQFATHIGETAPDFTKETKALMDTEPKFVLGLGLDHLGYVVPYRFFDKTKEIKFAEYQTSMSPGREAGPVMMKMLGEIIP